MKLVGEKLRLGEVSRFKRNGCEWFRSFSRASALDPCADEERFGLLVRGEGVCRGTWKFFGSATGGVIWDIAGGADGADNFFPQSDWTALGKTPCPLDRGGLSRPVAGRSLKREPLSPAKSSRIGIWKISAKDGGQY